MTFRMLFQLSIWWISLLLSANSQLQSVYDSAGATDDSDWSDWDKSGEIQAVNFNCPPSSQYYCLNLWGPTSFMSRSVSLEGFHSIEIKIVLKQSVDTNEFCQIVYYSDALPGWSNPVFQLTNGQAIAENVLFALPDDNTVNNKTSFQIKLENTADDEFDLCSVGKFIIYGIPILITASPTRIPTITLPPTNIPTFNPTTFVPTMTPTTLPTLFPTLFPTNNPSQIPTISPSNNPSKTPTNSPTDNPSKTATLLPTDNPSNAPIAINDGQQHVQTMMSAEPEPEPTQEANLKAVDANSDTVTMIAIMVGLIVCIVCIVVAIIGVVYCYHRIKIKPKNAMNMEMEMVEKMSSLSSVNSDNDVIGNTASYRFATDNTNNLNDIDREFEVGEDGNGNGTESTDDELFYEGNNDDIYTDPTPQDPNEMNVTCTPQHPQHPQHTLGIYEEEDDKDTMYMYTKGINKTVR